LDFILKTLQAFPTLSSEWLLHGKGTMESIVSSSETNKEITNQNDTETAHSLQKTQNPYSTSEIQQVLILRNDGTFQSFKEQNSLDLHKK
jgi:hypothetical protein